LVDLSLIITAQRYVVAILFLVVAIYWGRLKGIGLGSLFKNVLVVNLILFLGLPFIISVVPLIPKDVGLLIEVLGVFVLALVLFVVTFKDFKFTDTKRKKQLTELIEKPRHPIALEFARKIVEPEIKLVNRERRKLRPFFNFVSLLIFSYMWAPF